jgi:predicted methyltransferase
MLRLSIASILALVVPVAACAPQPTGSAQAPSHAAAPAPAAAASAPAASQAPAKQNGIEAIAEDPAAHDVTVAQALASAYRSDKNRQRDRYRHPDETLEFFGLKPDMTVIELWPGRGWYTEILAQVLAHRGRLIDTNFDPNGPQDKEPYRQARKLEQRMHDNPKLFGKVQIVHIDPPKKLDLGVEGQADMVLTFRNFHNWIKGGYAKQVVEAAYKALKPGGVFGVVEHRARPGTSLEQMKKTGYVTEAYLEKLVEGVGFKLAGESDINANPKDTKDYPDGVWTLPPTLRLGQQDRQKYLAIGESDRMTLKFVKPAAAARPVPKH